MKQLTLDISPPAAPALGNFVAGRNSELLQALQEFLCPANREACFYVWGGTGSGKSHLLEAATRVAAQGGLRVIQITWGNGIGDRESLAQLDLVTVDDVDRLDEEEQIILFDLYNRLREKGGRLLASGPAAPAQLALRPDLATRLGWGLVYQVHALTDEEKVHALQTHAHERGFALPPEVADYLLRHIRRDLPSLLATLDALDRHSLEAKRPITVPLLRQLLKPSIDLG